MANQHRKQGMTVVKAKHMPHFTLLASDNFAPVLLQDWINMAEAFGAPASKIAGARKILVDMENYRRENPVLCKTPD